VLEPSLSSRRVALFFFFFFLNGLRAVPPVPPQCYRLPLLFFPRFALILVYPPEQTYSFPVFCESFPKGFCSPATARLLLFRSLVFSPSACLASHLNGGVAFPETWIGVIVQSPFSFDQPVDSLLPRFRACARE